MSNPTPSPTRHRPASAKNSGRHEDAPTGTTRHSALGTRGRHPIEVGVSVWLTETRTGAPGPRVGAHSSRSPQGPAEEHWADEGGANAN